MNNMQYNVYARKYPSESQEKSFSHDLFCVKLRKSQDSDASFATFIADYAEKKIGCNSCFSKSYTQFLSFQFLVFISPVQPVQQLYMVPSVP